MVTSVLIEPTVGVKPEVHLACRCPYFAAPKRALTSYPLSHSDGIPRPLCTVRHCSARRSLLDDLIAGNPCFPAVLRVTGRDHAYSVRGGRRDVCASL
eukprot:2529366-Prymnesium_polylepis.1